MTPRKLRLVFATAFAAALALLQPAALAQPGDDTSRPVRPGIPGVRPFWNTYALRFIYAPAFDIPKTDGAASYRFTVLDHAGKTHTFTAPQSYAPLSPIWADVAEGYTTLTVQPLDAAGKAIGTPATRAFYRSPGFTGASSQPGPYLDAGRAGLKAIFEAPHVQHWLTDGTLDRSYARYCYPNKVIGGLLRAMTAYSRVADSDADRAAALKIARATADYLLSIRLPDSSPYAHCPPTYALNVDHPTHVTPPRVRDHWLMVTSAIDPTFGFLDLYDVTRDPKYLDAATAVADTFVRTQESDGTWPHMVDDRTGKPVVEQRLIPTWVLFLFDRLDRQYHLPQYRDARARAWDWIVAHPLKTYQWDAQFEDIKLREPYVNLAREQACDVAVLLMSAPNPTQEELARAEELLRFAEDQFAIWAPVQDVAGWRKAMPKRYKNCDIWIVPGVFEQYACYGPVARSAAILINAYLKAHEVTGNPLYLAKARALGNGMIAGQHWMAEHFGTNGEIPTWNMRRAPKNWLNNSYYAADAVLNLANHTTPTPSN